MVVGAGFIKQSDTVHYVHDLNGNVIAETDGAGGTVREYVWIEHRDSGSGQATGAATPLAVVADVDTATPKTYFVHPDHLDRPAMMTDASAGIVWNATFLPFGSVHQITGTAANDNRFPGQWYQLESGLHYNWHRHYDPDLGRYTQPDPLGLVDGPARYNYALASPVMYTDPRGEFAISGPTAIGVGIGILGRIGGRAAIKSISRAAGRVAAGLNIGNLILNNDKSKDDSDENEDELLGCPTSEDGFKPKKN